MTTKQQTAVLTGAGVDFLQDWHGEIADLAVELGAPTTLYPGAVEAYVAPRPELTLLTVLAFDGTTVVGAAHLTRGRWAGVWVYDKAGARGEPWGVLARRPEARAELTRAMSAEIAHIGPRWSLCLPDLAADDPLPGELAAVLRGVSRRAASRSVQMVFEPGRPITDYLTRNTRSAVAKARNRIRRDGLEIVEHWTADPDAIVGCLDEIVSVRRERNRDMRRTPYVGRASRQEIETFRGVIARHAREGRARLMAIRIGSALAAYAVCFRSADTLWVYSNSVSPDFVRYSAGTIANAEVVRAAHADPAVRELNWGAGVQRYKLSGRTSVVDEVSVQIWSSPAVRRALTARRLVQNSPPARACRQWAAQRV